MFSSFCIHVVLVISCVLFTFSYFSFIKRAQTYRNAFQSTKPSLISHYTDSVSQFSSFNITNKNLPNEQTVDERFLREKILGSSKIHDSILNRFTFINPRKPVCSYPKDTQHFMIIVILSRGLNFNFRQVIRATWGRNGKYKGSHIYVQTVFFVGTDDTVQSAIRDEQAMFNDVIEIGIPEKYPFVAHKELASLLWARLYCPLARIVFRADDDILLDVFLLLNYIQSNVNFDTKDGLYGWFRFNNTVHRADKWAVTKFEYKPKIYPPYTFGIGYLFSNVSCQRLIDAANHPNHQIIRIGDAYITGILRDLANISFYEFENLHYAYTFYNEIPCDDYFEKNSKLLMCMSKLHVGQRNDPYQFYDIWDIILARNNASTEILELIEFSPKSKHPEILETYNVHQSTFLSPNESIALNIHNRSTHFIYIDIGCFNGETVEYFIHFTPNSSLYDIITFEPDPVNYKLCKQKLSQPKYKTYNIIIIPKIAWIHNGKVSYHIDRGKRSRIYQSKTKDTSDLAKLDAIDFSSWLSQLPKSSDTKIHIKISMPGTEARVLRKMAADDTLSLADKLDVEWSDRSNPRTFPQRIYLQLMFDSSGFMCTGFTRLHDVRKVFKINGTYANITKYSDLRKLPDIDTYSHYIQRPIVIDPSRTQNPRVNSNKL